jgi:putative addiction module killer protein
MPGVELRQTNEFGDWLRRLRDERAKARIGGRIRRMEQGNPGDTRSLASGLMEMRIDYGPGYRVYFTHRSASLVLLICGGDKRTQQRDIAKARELMEQLEP